MLLYSELLTNHIQFDYSRKCEIYLLKIRKILYVWLGKEYRGSIGNLLL